MTQLDAPVDLPTYIKRMVKGSDFRVVVPVEAVPIPLFA